MALRSPLGVFPEYRLVDKVNRKKVAMRIGTHIFSIMGIMGVMATMALAQSNPSVINPTGDPSQEKSSLIVTTDYIIGAGRRAGYHRVENRGPFQDSASSPRWQDLLATDWRRDGGQSNQRAIDRGNFHSTKILYGKSDGVYCGERGQ